VLGVGDRELFRLWEAALRERSERDSVADAERRVGLAALMANRRDGNRPNPLSFPVRIRSSTRAWPRWRSSSSCSEQRPHGVSVTNT
jgi:hypothetical protein